MTHTRKPVTYIIDYSDHLDRVDEYVSSIAEAPPHLLHFAHEVPFPNTWGAMGTKNNRSYLISPKGVEKRIDQIADFTKKLHDAGVETVIPYICNQTVAGDPDNRKGIWKFYDHWDDYVDFGFGPRPPDPMEWLAREEYGRPHYNYEKRHRAFVPLGMQRYAPCPNNPHYRKYQKGVVENIAKVDYDGVFVDNCVLNCYCKHCQTKFKEHVQNNYRAQEQREFFGFEDPADINLGTRGSKFQWVKTEETFVQYLKENFPKDIIQEWLGVEDPSEAWIEEGGNGWLWNMADRYLTWLETRYSPADLQEAFGVEKVALWGIRNETDRALWAETKLFWARSVADNLKYIKEIGAAIRPPFVILPNWGEMQLMDGNEFREEIGHDLREWQRHSDLQMFEESNEPGRVAPGVYLDFQLELKFALANDVRGCILSHAGRDAATAELSYAECLGGNGSYIQPGVSFPEVRRKYRNFQDEHADLLEGFAPYYRVGVAYFYNQLHLENREHVLQVYKFSRYLLDQHILFQFVTEEDLSPQVRLPCRVLILPNVQYLTDDQVSALSNFMKAGGICFATGDLGIGDGRSRPRDHSVVDSLTQSYPERFVHVQSLSSLIPDGDTSLDSTRQLSRTTWKTLNVPGAQSFQAMKHLDDELGIQRYLDGGSLLGTIRSKLDGAFQLVPARSAIGVRFNAYAGDQQVLLHAVNFNVDLTAPSQERTVSPVRDVPVTMALPAGFALKRIRMAEPGADDEELAYSQGSAGISLRIPEITFYKMMILEG